MNHSFDIEYAEKYGLEEAIVIENFIFWIRKNYANKDSKRKIEIAGNIQERTFTYNSAKALVELFPYFSESQIYRIMASLEKQGVLIKAHFNSNNHNRITWYCFRDEVSFLEIVKRDKSQFTKTENAIHENEKSILQNREIQFTKSQNHYTDINTDIKPNENKDIIDKNLFEKEKLKKLFLDHHKNHLLKKKQSELKQTFYQIESLGSELDWSIEQYEKLIYWKSRHEFWFKTTDTAHYLLKALKDVALLDIPVVTKTLDDELMERIA